jgi:hypothetical protein
MFYCNICTIFDSKEDSMSKDKNRPSTGINGLPLPIMPPERDGRVWGKMVRVAVYTPGFLAILLIKAGEPSGFGLTVALLMLASASAIVAGLFIGTQSTGSGADHSSKTGVWCGSLILELLAVVPILCAVPPLFHELSHSELLHGAAHKAAQIAAPVSIGPSEFLPAVAILPFMLYQLAGFGTLHYIVPKTVNWIINVGILVLIVASHISNRQGLNSQEMIFSGLLISSMAILVLYGVLKLRQMQEAYDMNLPPKASETAAEK